MNIHELYWIIVYNDLNANSRVGSAQFLSSCQELSRAVTKQIWNVQTFQKDNSALALSHILNFQASTPAFKCLTFRRNKVKHTAQKKDLNKIWFMRERERGKKKKKRVIVQRSRVWRVRRCSHLKGRSNEAMVLRTVRRRLAALSRNEVNWTANKKLQTVNVISVLV